MDALYVTAFTLVEHPVPRCDGGGLVFRNTGRGEEFGVELLKVDLGSSICSD